MNRSALELSVLSDAAGAVMDRPPDVTARSQSGVLTLALSGAWTAQTARDAEAALERAFDGKLAPTRVKFSGDAIARLDTVGCWLIVRKQRKLADEGAEVSHAGFSTSNARLIAQIEGSETEPAPPKRRTPFYARPFEALGRGVFGAGNDVAVTQAVQGRILAAFGAVLGLRGRLRVTSVINQFELIVYKAVPIVVLISLVVGAIVTQQSLLQLRNFGAQIFVVDLAAILMLREVGLLLAAIMIAGRSGSAITAELGSMRMREEIDALTVMGVDPYQALILPRMMALIIGLPLLAFIGGIAGLAGAAIVANLYGGIEFGTFVSRLQGALTLSSVLVGLIKAPIMGFIIGLIATHEGFKVEGSSESLGRHTTASVVKAIFAVIVADGLFAVFFAAIGV